MPYPHPQGLHRATRRLTGSQPGKAQAAPGPQQPPPHPGSLLAPSHPAWGGVAGTCPSEVGGDPCLAPTSPKGSKHLPPPRQKPGSDKEEK